MINYNNIDKGFRQIIKGLNDKGWVTRYCCEGHYDEDRDRYVFAYLYFDAPIPIEFQPILDSYTLVDEKDWCKRLRNKSAYSWKKNEQVFYWVGSGYKKMTMGEKFEEHNKFLNDLQNWVDNLPYKEYNKDESCY